MVAGTTIERLDQSQGSQDDRETVSGEPDDCQQRPKPDWQRALRPDGTAGSCSWIPTPSPWSTQGYQDCSWANTSSYKVPWLKHSPQLNFWLYHLCTQSHSTRSSFNNYHVPKSLSLHFHCTSFLHFPQSPSFGACLTQLCGALFSQSCYLAQSLCMGSPL